LSYTRDGYDGNAFGVRFEGENKGSQTIDGTFIIDAYGTAEGIRHNSKKTSNSLDASGVFSVVSQTADAFGIRFHSDAKGSITYGGVFNVKTQTGEANGIRFEKSFTGNVLNIDAICNVHAHKNAFGVYFADANATGIITFSDDTYFSIYSDNAIAVGIAFNSTFQGTLLEIGGTYVVYSTSNEARGIS
jgi:hypothetical protein